jgi:hypothetical protein
LEYAFNTSMCIADRVAVTSGDRLVAAKELIHPKWPVFSEGHARQSLRVNRPKVIWNRGGVRT